MKKREFSAQAGSRKVSGTSVRPIWREEFRGWRYCCQPPGILQFFNPAARVGFDNPQAKRYYRALCRAYA